MDARQQQALWAIAREHYDAAELCAQREFHNVSIACSYYAVYTAIWIALDNPPQGQWSHAGILQHFATGQWRQPAAPFERVLTRAVRRLYNARIHAQYMGERHTGRQSTEALCTAQQVLELVASLFRGRRGGARP